MRGTRGLVTTFDDSTGSVGDSSAPSSNDSVQPRSVSAWVINATSRQVSGMARTSLRNGRCQAFWSISASTSSPSRNRISIEGDHREPAGRSPSAARRSSTLQATLAEHEAGHHEQRRERQEAAPRQARQQRARHQQSAEHGSWLLQELDRGRDGHVAELSQL